VDHTEFFQVAIKTLQPKDPKDPDSMEYKVGNVLNRLSLDLPMLKEKSIQAFELSGHRIGLTFLGTSFSGKTLRIRTPLVKPTH
jgi:hypothetical protein